METGTNTQTNTNSECCTKIRWWPWYLIGGLTLLFLILIIILRGLCTDVWYIRLLRLNTKLCPANVSISTNNIQNQSITTSKIAEGVIGFTLLSQPLQQFITNTEQTLNQISQQIGIPQVGPPGAEGLQGAVGPPGPAGPEVISNNLVSSGNNLASTVNGISSNTVNLINTNNLSLVGNDLISIVNGVSSNTVDIASGLTCSTIGTFFCQNGNSFGTTAILGTNDSFNLVFETSGIARALFNTSGHFLPNLDDTYNLGSDAARWRDLYLGPGSLNIGASGSNYTTSYDTAGIGTLVFNEAASNHDLRIEGTTQANLLFIDASANNIGIGTSAPNSGAILHIAGVATSPDGTNSERFGLNSSASGADAVAFGNNADAICTGGVAIGRNAATNSINCLTGDSIAIGRNAKTQDDTSIVIGSAQTAFEAGTIMIGISNTSQSGSDNGIAIGQSNTLGTNRTNLILIGYSNSGNDDSIVMGTSNSVTGTDSVILGLNNTGGSSDNSYVIGESNTVTGSVELIGNSNTFTGSPNGDNSVVHGDANTINLTSGSNLDSITIGFDNTITRTSSNANAAIFGFNNTITAGSADDFMAIGLGINNSVADSLQVGMSNAGKVTILSTGAVDIGAASSPTHKLTVTDTSTTNVTRFNGSGGTQCTVVTGTGWSCTSDDSLKTNEVDLNVVGILAKLGALRPITFQWQAEYDTWVAGGMIGPPPDIQYGFIAQEVETILPEVVETDSLTGLKMINYGRLTTFMIAALKENYQDLQDFQSTFTFPDPNSVEVSRDLNIVGNKLSVTDTSDDTPASFTGTSGTCTVNTSTGGWSCTSDERLKTNIMTIGNGLDAILALNGVTYNWKTSPNGDIVAGFIAQEVEKVLPNLVSELDDGTKTLDKVGMIPYIVEAIKTQDGELQEVNNQLSQQGLQLSVISDELKAIAERLELNTAEIKDLREQVKQIPILESKLKELEIKLNQSN